MAMAMAMAGDGDGEGDVEKIDRSRSKVEADRSRSKVRGSSSKQIEGPEGRCRRSRQRGQVSLSLSLSLSPCAPILDWIAFLSPEKRDSYTLLSRKRGIAILPRKRHLVARFLQLRSNSMAQYNLLGFCLGDKPATCPGIQKLLRIYDLREKHRYKTYSNVSPKLKAIIFNHLLEIMRSSNDDPLALCTHRGSFVLKQYDLPKFEWSTKVEFDQSILIWHIATDLCYYMEDGGVNTANKEESKQISDYMLYLLVMCPALLPIGIGMIRFRDTCAEARLFFEERSSITGDGFKFKANACEKLLQVNTEVLPIKVKGDRSKSVLFDACRLAKSLRAMKEQKWGIMSLVWVEMLAYAATHCRGNHHIQQLRKGGELLTHVWLLMAHLGITEQFQIYQGHARAKLNDE